jgi:excisionase family DNA binding protein
MMTNPQNTAEETMAIAKRVLTVKEVADYLHVHQSTIYRMLKRSQLPAFRVGSDWRFNVETIDRWRLSADSRSTNSM